MAQRSSSDASSGPSTSTVTVPVAAAGKQLVISTSSQDQTGTGGQVWWPAANALCWWQSTNELSFRGTRVLELGSGTGVCGLHAAAIGASYVMLTDDGRPSILAICRDNVNGNAELFPTSTVEVDTLEWGSEAHQSRSSWDWVIGSDITYVQQGCQRLCQTIRSLLATTRHAPRVVLAHQDRPDFSQADAIAIASEVGLVAKELWSGHSPSIDAGEPAVRVAILELVLMLPIDVSKHPNSDETELVVPNHSKRLQLRMAAFDRVGSGGIVWHAAKVLCRWLSSTADELRGARVLELGCGTGACGLYAAALGASRVTLTDDDRPALLDLARSNVQLNAALYPTAVVDVQPLVWGGRASALLAAQWEWVLGADLTYIRRGIDDLFRTLRELLWRSHAALRVVLAHQDRMDNGTLDEVRISAHAAGLTVTELHADHTSSWDAGSTPAVLVVLLEVSLAPPASIHVRPFTRITRGNERLDVGDGRRMLLRTATHGSGGIVWHAAKVLCRWLSSTADELRGARVLELGCGTGACGLYAAALGASRVTLTDDDRPALLDLARSNVQLNAALYPTAVVDVQPLVWGGHASALPHEALDLVIGSDITYGGSVRRLLCTTLHNLLAAQKETKRHAGAGVPRAILSHQVRTQDGSMELLLADALAAKLEFEQLHTEQDASSSYPPATFVVFELKLREP